MPRTIAFWAVIFNMMILIFCCGSRPACANEGSFIWFEDFEEDGLERLEASGWTTTHRDGVSFGSDGVILNGTAADTPIHYWNHFDDIGSEWRVEVRARWLGAGHSGLNVFMYTQNHSYGLSADGYYNTFKFYRDDRTELTFGSYLEKKGEWVIISMMKEGGTISFFFEGEFKNRYVESIDPDAGLTGVAMISPWRGDAEYDYIGIAVPDRGGSSGGILGIPTPVVLVGGGLVGALIAGGGALAYFLTSGGGAGAAAGGSAVSSGGAAASVTPSAATTASGPTTTTAPGGPGTSATAPETSPGGSSFGEPFDNVTGTVPEEPSVQSALEPDLPNDEGGFWHFFSDLWTSLWGL